MKFYKYLTILFAASICGCASTPPPLQTVPLSLQNKTNVALTGSELLKITFTNLTHLNENKDILYQQNFGGGGAASALAFGIIGAIANASALESETKNDAKLLFNKIKINPNIIFSEVVAATGFNVVNIETASAKLTPYILTSRGKNNVIYIAAGLLVDDKISWTGKYIYQIDYEAPKIKIANGLTDEEQKYLEGEVKRGFLKLLNTYKIDSQGTFPSKVNITFNSEFMSARVKMDFLGQLIDEDDRDVFIRTSGGIYIFPKKLVTTAAQ